MSIDFDPSVFGNLKGHEPLSVGERLHLRSFLKTGRDRAAFETIERERMRSENACPSLEGRTEQFKESVQAFGREFGRRLEAKQLRELVEQVQLREKAQTRKRGRSR